MHQKVNRVSAQKTSNRRNVKRIFTKLSRKQKKQKPKLSDQVQDLVESRRRSQETYRLETNDLHTFTITIEEFQEKRKTDLEDVKVTY